MFSASSATLRTLAEGDGGFDVMMAYIILARGASIRSSRRISAYSSRHIASKTHMEHARVEAALRWLSGHGIIELHEPANGQDKVVRWTLLDDIQDIYVPTLLTDNKRRAPPIMRLQPVIEAGRPAVEHVLDDLLVLLMLYKYQDMDSCGGVDPRSGLYRQWLNVAAGKFYPHEVVNIIGSDAAIYEIGGATELMYRRFADDVLPFVVDSEERHDRVFNALWHLRHLGFVYEVSQIWDSNPNGDDGVESMPLYTHYIHDQGARGLDPSLQREIQRVAYRLGVMDGYDEFSELDYTNAETVKFRYVADKQVGGYPIGIYRLKYRHTRTNITVDNDAESRRANAWLKELQELYFRQP